MYERGCAAAAAGCSATLPVTGMNVGWAIVAGATLLIAGLAVMRLVPAVRRNR